MNSSGTLIAARRIYLGRDVMIGRGVVIYDSDHHTIQNARGEITNPHAPVSVGDHVWLATNVTVLKGSVIGSGSVVSANTLVHGTIPPHTLYHPGAGRADYDTWSREHP